MKPINENPLNFNLIQQEFELFRDSIIGVQSDLRDYHQVLEKLLAEAEGNEEDKLLASVEHLQEPRRSEVLDWHIPYWWSQTFVPQFRASFVVWAISVLELHLEWAARLAGSFTQTAQASAAVGRGSTVSKYRKFFSRLPGFEAPTNNAWSRLANLYAIRKTLAHSGAHVMFESEERQKRLKAALKDFRGIALSYNVVLEVDEVFCEDVVNLVSSFCDYLLVQLTRAREAFLLRNPG
jgi:hypothetical protein